MRPTLEQIRTTVIPTQPFRWNLYFIQFPVVGDFGGITKEDLNLRCETTEQPKMTGEKITMAIRGQKIFVPGIYNYSGTLTVTFIETINNKIANVIRKWNEVCWSFNEGKAENVNDVKAIIQLVRLDHNDNDIYKFDIFGVFLDDFDDGALDGATSDVRKPSLTFSYDNYKAAEVS